MTKNAAPDRAAWARAMSDPAAFAHEQAQLGQVWTLLGLTTDIPNDNDWFRATLGGRSVFVQRFGDMIKGFENVCRHRFFPLRTRDRGNGVIRCGYHHWQYNKDGLAVGIPHCQELFGMTPRELGARLTPVEIATCGMAIFGRFAAPHATETLEQYLGDGYLIIQALCNRTTPPHRLTIKAKANWRALFHIGLDDYHLVAVHPKTFGKDGYLKQDTVRYFRLGRHSAYFNGTENDAIVSMIAQCRDGTYRPYGYRIFQFFPNVSIVQLRALKSWYILLMQYIAVAPDRTEVRIWFYPAPFPATDKSWLASLVRRYLEFWMPPFLWAYVRRVIREDASACEQGQTVAHQIDGLPILGRQEERIAWFEETYAEAMQAPPLPPPPMASGVSDSGGHVAVAFTKDNK
ncbi:MAG: Rieske 2Fe-2S domain-containing protein [Pseudolabrys sp.]|nr:Rieske 2Fe-2S domain-containing protein [Pseudolabrys sp.]